MISVEGAEVRPLVKQETVPLFEKIFRSEVSPTFSAKVFLKFGKGDPKSFIEV